MAIANVKQLPDTLTRTFCQGSMAQLYKIHKTRVTRELVIAIHTLSWSLDILIKYTLYYRALQKPNVLH